MDLLRFTNSGTEATLMTLAAAKVYTKRNKIVVFAGAYHGGAFAFAGGKTSPVNAPHEYVKHLIPRPSCDRILERMDPFPQVFADMMILFQIPHLQIQRHLIRARKSGSEHW